MSDMASRSIARRVVNYDLWHENLVSEVFALHRCRVVKAAAGGGDPLEEPPHGSEVGG